MIKELFYMGVIFALVWYFADFSAYEYCANASRNNISVSGCVAK